MSVSLVITSTAAESRLVRRRALLIRTPGFPRPQVTLTTSLLLTQRGTLLHNRTVPRQQHKRHRAAVAYLQRWAGIRYRTPRSNRYARPTRTSRAPLAARA